MAEKNNKVLLQGIREVTATRRSEMINWYSNMVRVTAGEFRASGVRIPPNIPDNAWIPRHAVNTVTSNYHLVSADPKNTCFSVWVSFQAPFTWSEDSEQDPDHDPTEHRLLDLLTHKRDKQP
jgi:hypothetical protein